MRFTLLLLFCGFSLTASGQWWRININLNFKRHERFPQLSRLKDHSVSNIRINTAVSKPLLTSVNLNLSDYSLELAEASTIKSAQRNMRFKEYNTASYNFSDLAQLYIRQNRLSEAKWYYLQSISISRQQNDDRHTIYNLMGLALIKAMLSDFESSRNDLTEAREIARAHGLQTDLAQVDAEANYIKANKTKLAKTEVHYAEALNIDSKSAQ